MKSRVVVYGACDLKCDHLQKAIVQGIRRGSGKSRYCHTQGGGRISKLCRDLINSISFLSHVNMKSRVVEYGACDLTCDHLQKAIVQGIRRGSGKCRYCLTQAGGRIS